MIYNDIFQTINKILKQYLEKFSSEKHLYLGKMCLLDDTLVYVSIICYSCSSASSHVPRHPQTLCSVNGIMLFSQRQVFALVAVTGLVLISPASKASLSVCLH